MQAIIDGGHEALELARSLIAAANPADKVALQGPGQLLAPLPEPIQIRDCLCFEDHLVGGLKQWAKAQGRAELNQQELDRVKLTMSRPFWYTCNRLSIVGPDETVRWPRYSKVIDYELELAVVIGKSGANISAEAASSHIFGYSIYNDFSARDVQQDEMASGLGPSRSKNFDTGNALGPCIVTADEFDPYDAKVRVRINDKIVSENNTGGISVPFEELISFISFDQTLHAGEIICSGTVGGQCGLERGEFLSPGDTIDLEIEGIGRLRNHIAPVL